MFDRILREISILKDKVRKIEQTDISKLNTRIKNLEKRLSY